jgi:hypothetical protein
MYYILILLRGFEVEKGALKTPNIVFKPYLV